MTTDVLKRKLRQLKKLEARIRFPGLEPTGRPKYIWNEYFSTDNEDDSIVKYNLKTLLGLDRQTLKEVFDEYFYHVYYQYYKENGITLKGVYDADLLSDLGLPPDATIGNIKSRFRELAKKYHPDVGGDSSKFIELMSIYKKLTDGE